MPDTGRITSPNANNILATKEIGLNGGNITQNVTNTGSVTKSIEVVRRRVIVRTKGQKTDDTAIVIMRNAALQERHLTRPGFPQQDTLGNDRRGNIQLPDMAARWLHGILCNAIVNMRTATIIETPNARRSLPGHLSGTRLTTTNGFREIAGRLTRSNGTKRSTTIISLQGPVTNENYSHFQLSLTRHHSHPTRSQPILIVAGASAFLTKTCSTPAKAALTMSIERLHI